VHFNLVASLESPVPVQGGFISNGLFDDYSLMLMDANGKPIREISARPPFSKREVDHLNGRRMLNRNFLVQNPSDSQIALVYQFSNRVDLFTREGVGLGTIVTPRKPKLRYDYGSVKFYWRPGNEMGYSSAAGTTRYIYAVYCGCLMGEVNPPAMVHVFTWDGAFVGELQLDRPIAQIAVSGNDSLLFGGSPGPEPKVVEWKLPEWTKIRSPKSFNGERLTLR
jgi:hypothetical protein